MYGFLPRCSALLCSSCVFNICERMQQIQPKRIDGTKCLALLCCSNETTSNVQEQPASHLTASVYMIVMIGTVQQVALNCTDSNRRKSIVSSIFAPFVRFLTRIYVCFHCVSFEVARIGVGELRVRIRSYYLRTRCIPTTGCGTQQGSRYRSYHR